MLFRTVSARRIVMSLWVPLAFLNACGGAPGQAVATLAASEEVRAINAAEANDLEQALRNDVDAKAVMAMTTELLDRADAAGISRSAYATAARNGGVLGAADALGMPRAEFKEFADRFQRHMDLLIQRYPALAEIQSHTAAVSADEVASI